MNNIELKDIREKLLHTQQDMADILHCSIRMYQYYESGMKPIPELIQCYLKYIAERDAE